MDVKVALEAVFSACLYTNDKADGAAILACSQPDDTSFVVTLHDGVWNHDPGNTKKFKVTIEEIEDDSSQSHLDRRENLRT